MNQIRKNIIVLNEVESTNNYANQLVLSNAADEGTVVLARYQEIGRGQLGNRWESQTGKNLLASIVLTPQFLSAGKQFLISKLTSLALVDILEKRTGKVAIKWPNDVYIENKKVAGILIENSIKGQNLFSSIVGIGLNLNQEKFISDAPNPVSLKQITGVNFDVNEVLDEIFDAVFNWYEKLKSGNYDEINSAYLNHLFAYNKWRMYRKQGVLFEARIIGIGEFGHFRLEERKGNVSEYAFKEVEFVFEDE